MSILAVIGTYWHRIDTIVCFSEGWKSGFVPCNLNKVQAYTPPYSLSSFGQLGHRETMLWKPKQQHLFKSVYWRISCALKSTARCPSSYPKAFRLLPKSGSSKVCFELLETFRVTPRKPCRWLHLRSRATWITDDTNSSVYSQTIWQETLDDKLMFFLFLTFSYKYEPSDLYTKRQTTGIS